MSVKIEDDSRRSGFLLVENRFQSSDQTVHAFFDAAAVKGAIGDAQMA